MSRFIEVLFQGSHALISYRNFNIFSKYQIFHQRHRCHNELTDSLRARLTGLKRHPGF